MDVNEGGGEGGGEAGVEAIAYLVESQKGVLDGPLVHVVLHDMVPTDDRVHGPTAIASQIHSSLRVPLRQTSSYGLSKFGGVGESDLVEQRAVFGSPVAWRGRAAGGGERGVGAA